MWHARAVFGALGGAASDACGPCILEAAAREPLGIFDVLGAQAFPLGIEAHARRQDSLTCAECSRHLDDHLSRRPPGLGIADRVTAHRLIESRYSVPGATAGSARAGLV